MQVLCARTRFVRIMTYPTDTRMALVPLRTASKAGGEINGAPSVVAQPLWAVRFCISDYGLPACRQAGVPVLLEALLHHGRRPCGAFILVAFADPSQLLRLHQQ